MKFFSSSLLVVVVLLLARTTALVIPLRLQGSSPFDDQFPLDVVYGSEQEGVAEPCLQPTPTEPPVPVATNTLTVSTTEVELERVILEERPVGDDGAVEIVEEVVVEEVIETVMEIVYDEPAEEDPAADYVIVEEQPAVQPETAELEVGCED